MPLSRRIPESSIGLSGLYSTIRFINFPFALLFTVGAEVGHKAGSVWPDIQKQLHSNEMTHSETMDRGQR